VPFVVGETAETLKAREVSAAVYGGGGAFTGTGTSGAGCCGGVMGRLRVGVGRSQEVGVEGGAYLDNGGAWGTAKLAWKLQLNEHYAIIGGVGASFLSGAVGLGGDAGVIASTSPWRESISLYAGLRATMMIDTGGAISDGGGVLSGGMLFALPRQLRVALELGVIGAGAHNRQPGNFAPSNAGWFGGYGAALLSYAWRR
jgi:hypothetical protein